MDKNPIHCNKCGNLCDIHHTDGSHMGYYGLINAKTTGGYMSEHLEDMTGYEFSLCEKCLLDLFGTFKMPHKQYNIGWYGYEESITHEDIFIFELKK